MKFGVLGFSYAGFDHFARAIEHAGHYTANLGDNAQTIGARHIYRTLGVRDEDMILIDRDTLCDYAGPPAFLLMNGVFLERSLPTPPQITPLFVGFNASEAVIRKHRSWLKEHEPIGCRDTHTADLLRNMRVDAFTCGCVTMALPPRTRAPESGRLLVVYGAGAGALPMSVLRHVPPELLGGAELIHHRLPSSELPLSPETCAWVERLELDILQRYRDEAALVLTPLLHVASPCLAMQVPVVVCRIDLDSRFSLLRQLMPIYTPDRLSEINWRPKIIDASAYANAIIGRVQALLKY
jgi:Polysaccharide pyruvyl transferase